MDKGLGGQVQISRLAKAQQVPVRVYYDPKQSNTAHRQMFLSGDWLETSD